MDQRLFVRGHHRRQQLYWRQTAPEKYRKHPGMLMAGP
ncbi:hypothetical protein LTSEWAN_1605 [Salmonella enterica subsp. enterica serovar Wandsworth str. A4-580]|uniref:Uncharacterized protein n=1 Tax=Salmonella enterica subsp. enterica serovar Wandsworth str. A4-580 TaxID=913086 RepID=G5S9F5_SALET|nr:hypothetical protein LTSEWAN_1605 [Salmonella enterica subsp. enterica serovar Wandsworth str. A4-580]